MASVLVIMRVQAAPTCGGHFAQQALVLPFKCGKRSFVRHRRAKSTARGFADGLVWAVT